MVSQNRPGLGRRLLNMFGTYGSLQSLASFGGSGVTTAIVTEVVRRLRWFSGPTLVLFSVGVFLLVTAFLLIVLQRFWFRRMAVGDRYGTGVALVGISDELDRQIFARVPKLRRDAFNIAQRLSKFLAKQREQVPRLNSKTPGSPTPEETDLHTNAMTAFQSRLEALYDLSWKSDVARVFEEARALFYGPVPTSYHDYHHNYRRVRSLQEAEWVVAMLEHLDQRLPTTYTDAIHQHHIDSLRKLRSDGLTLVLDIGTWHVNRQKEATGQVMETLQAAANDEGRSRVAWEADAQARQEIETEFTANFGPRVKAMWDRLVMHGLSDEQLDRFMGWPHGMRISSYEIPSIGAAIGALCQRIPYM